MEVDVTTLSQGDAGKIELAASVFEQPVRKDVLHQVVLWQLAKRRQGTHAGKTRGEVKATTKPRCTSKRVPAVRSHGSADVDPVPWWWPCIRPRKPRDYSHRPSEEGSVPWALKSALSAKLKPRASWWFWMRRRSPSRRPRQLGHFDWPSMAGAGPC